MSPTATATGQTCMFQADRDAEERAAGYAEDVHRWVLADAARFRELQRAVLYLHECGAPIQQGRIHAELVARGYHMSDDTLFANNRNNWPSLSRYLRAFFPQLKESVHIRRSYLDNLTLKAVPFGYFEWGAQCQNRPIGKEDWT